jgi:DNA-binding XRE family transcriptional regulator
VLNLSDDGLTLQSISYFFRDNMRSTSASASDVPSAVVREEQKITQEEAAERQCGLHRTYYSGIERGVRNVSLVNVERIGRGLKTALPKLFERV